MKFSLILLIWGIFSLSSALGYVLKKQHHLFKIAKTNSISSKNYNREQIRFVTESDDDLDETTKKYGLEAGLYKAVTSKPDEKQKLKPQDLLKKYGAAYLITSITLAIISYAICYLLISTGVDVVSLLEKIGIQSTTATSNAGTAAIAYAVHKAASPIRFPPTVALTPVVAGWIGKKPVVEDETKK